MNDTALRRFLRRLRPGGDPVERCVPDVRHDIYHAFVAMYRFARPLARRRRVLDAGCGTGFGARYLAEHGAGHVTGIDLEPRAVAYARRHFAGPRVEFLTTVDNHWPVASGSADLVFSSNVVEHVEDIAGYLHEVRRVLAPGGALLLVTPVVETAGLSDHPYHITNLTPEDWRETLCERFRAVHTFGVHLRSHPQHTIPWQLTPLVQRLAVHPVFRAVEAPVRVRIERDLLFNPFGLWEGDFEVEPCEATTRAMASSMAFVAVCDDGGVDPETLTMRREPRVWSEEDLRLARCWRELRRAFTSQWEALAGPAGEPPPEDAAWCPPPELWGSRRLRGEFTAPGRSVAGLRIDFATFARSNTCRVDVALIDSRGSERARATVDAAVLEDGKLHAVRFEHPIATAPGERWAFDLWSSDAVPGNAVTAWTRYDCGRIEPGVAPCDVHGAWGGVVHEVLGE